MRARSVAMKIYGPYLVDVLQLRMIMNSLCYVGHGYLSNIFLFLLIFISDPHHLALARLAEDIVPALLLERGFPLGTPGGLLHRH